MGLRDLAAVRHHERVKHDDAVVLARIVDILDAS